MRKAVDEIEVDPLKAEAASLLVGEGCHCIALPPADRLLDNWIEILDSEAHSVEAEMAEMGELLPSVGEDAARVDFDREFSGGGGGEVAFEMREERRKLLAGERGGGAATEVELGEGALLREVGGDEGDLLEESGVVALLFDRVSVEDDRAGAKEAHRLAKRDVEIEGEGAGRETFEERGVGIGGKGGELGGGRVAGVARDGAVPLGKEAGI